MEYKTIIIELYFRESQITVGNQTFTLKADMVSVKRYSKKVHGEYMQYYFFLKTAVYNHAIEAWGSFMIERRLI